MRKDWGDDDEEVSDVFGTTVHRRVGPPGCGKTTYLARQVVHASSKYGRTGVVVASLTRAAAAEVAGRKTQLPRRNIGTLHAHAFHALGRPGLCETSEGLKEWNAFAPSSTYKIDGKYAVDPENAAPEQAVFDTQGAELLNQASVLRQRMIPVEGWPPRVKRFHAKWEAWKVHANRRDFTDLIEDAIEKVDELPGNPDVILLDEAQDMSKLEMTWAVQIGMKAKQFVIVGDPDQNLYQWRGSDPEAFYQAEAATESVLSQSYRVPAAVHERAVAWVETIPGRRSIDYNPRFNDPSDPLSGTAMGSCTEAGHYWKDPTSLVRQIEKDLAVTGQDVMVLASCGYMLVPLIRELRDRGIPFHNPYRTNNGAWNPMRAGRRLLAFKRPDGKVWGDENRMWTWEDLKAWMEVMQARGNIVHGGKAVVESRQIKDKFGDDGSKEEVDLFKALHLFEEEHWDAVMGMDIDWWERCLKHADRQRQDYPLRIARMHGAAVLRQRPRLVLGTIHSVKGGEARRVYVFPDLSATAHYHGYKKVGQSHDAVVRQFYVAMTRASEDLILCKASGAEAVRW